MFRRKLRRQDELLDRVGAEVLLAARVREDEISAVADSPDLYVRLRLRIASGRELQSHTEKSLDRAKVESRFAGVIFNNWRTMQWPLSIAVAILLLIAVALTLWQSKLGTERAKLAQPAPQLPASNEPANIARTQAPSQEEAASVAAVPAVRHSKAVSYRRPKLNYRTNEVATDFLPLTFLADSNVQESGHIVRVSVPRSALIAFGVPMNVERVGEFIMADVVIGDDGLARAIRFVQ